MYYLLKFIKTFQEPFWFQFYFHFDYMSVFELPASSALFDKRAAVDKYFTLDGSEMKNVKMFLDPFSG